MTQPNPYEAPESSFFEEGPSGLEPEVEPWSLPPLASRGSRWGAAFIDGLLVGLLTAGIAIATTGFDASDSDEMSMMGALLVLGGMVVLGGINLYLLHKNGQTIGKKLLKIKIVRADRRTRAELWRLLVLRTFPQWLIQFIPMIGGLLGLTDVLFIFREDRKCVHDMIADTIVVEDNEYTRATVEDVDWRNPDAPADVDSQPPIW